MNTLRSVTGALAFTISLLMAACATGPTPEKLEASGAHRLTRDEIKAL